MVSAFEQRIDESFHVCEIRVLGAGEDGDSQPARGSLEVGRGTAVRADHDDASGLEQVGAKGCVESDPGALAEAS